MYGLIRTSRSLIFALGVLASRPAPAAAPALTALQPGEPVVVRKILPEDCRLVRGFTHAPVDGRTDTRHAKGGVSEWSGMHGVPAVNYREFNGNNGLHVTLPAGAFDALQIRGGWQGHLYADLAGLELPTNTVPVLCEIVPQDGTAIERFSPPVNARRLSFFYVEDQTEPIADMGFFEITPGGAVSTSSNDMTFGLDAPIDPGERLHAAVSNRFGTGAQLYGLSEAGAAGGSLTTNTPLQLFTPLQDPAFGIAAVGLELDIINAPSTAVLTVAVHDVVDARREAMGVDVAVVGTGTVELVLDIPDQVLLPPTNAWTVTPRLEGDLAPPPTLWISLASDTPLELAAVRVTLYRTPRADALVEAGAWRAFLLKGLFSCMSEPRPWMHLVEGPPVRQQLTNNAAILPYTTSLTELLETVEIAQLLMPEDPLVRQYHDWIYQHMDRYKPHPPPALPPPDGAPQWAVLLRETWRHVSAIPRWWLDNRLTSRGLIGGGIQDDTDMFQTWQCLPMIESEPLGADLLRVAAALAQAACEDKLEEGINRNTMDALHAYEEGINQLALCAWWFYGDPVHFERAMASARSAMQLMVKTGDGRWHFGGDHFGIEQVRNGFDEVGLSPGSSGWAPARLLLHPMHVVAWYNGSPLVTARFEQWGQTWAGYQTATQFVGQVDIASGTPTEVMSRACGPTYEWMALYALTGDDAWRQPLQLGMLPGEYWGFQASYGYMPYALVPWDEPYQTMMREKFDGGGSGYAAFFLNKDRALLDRWLNDSASWYGRFPHMHTAAEQKTDRVFTYNASTPMACALGSAPNRNLWLNLGAVSYEGLRGEDFAALVWDASADALRVAIYNFHNRKQRGILRVWRLDHGTYRVRMGPDPDDDGQMDSVASNEVLDLQRYAPISLELPPRQVTVVEVEQLTLLDDITDRPDPAVSRFDTQLDPGGGVTVRVHNIGAQEAHDIVVVLKRDGFVIDTETIGSLEAPLDLYPRMASVYFDLARAGDVVEIDPDHAISEIAEHNNRLELRTGTGLLGSMVFLK